MLNDRHFDKNNGLSVSSNLERLLKSVNKATEFLVVYFLL